MRAAIISGNSKSSQWTAEAMRKYFDHVDHLFIKYVDITFGGKTPEVLYKTKSLEKYDCLYVKGSFRYMQLLRSLSEIFSGNPDIYLPYKPDAYTVAHDKLLTQLVIQEKQIPMPKTYLSATIDAARQILTKVNYPIVMKFPQGTQGKGVMFAESFASASSILDALDALKQPFLIQEYVETNGSDIRLFVVGDKVVAAMKRKSNGDEKRANFHAGGICEAFVPDATMRKIAVEVAQAIGAEICGVDILEGTKGPLVLEANVSPGLQGITDATKVDVADKIAKYLYEKTAEKIGAHKDAKAKEIMAELNVGEELITTLDFRGEKILLPEIVGKKTGFSGEENVQMNFSKGKLTIKKFM